jgi:hypothetical protein
MADDEIIRVTVDQALLDWDALEEIENTVGRPIADEMASGKWTFPVIRAVVLWKLRQTNPEMTRETMPSIRTVQVNLIDSAKVTGATKRDPLATTRPRRPKPSQG